MNSSRLKFHSSLSSKNSTATTAANSSSPLHTHTPPPPSSGINRWLLARWEISTQHYDRETRGTHELTAKIKSFTHWVRQRIVTRIVAPELKNYKILSTSHTERISERKNWPKSVFPFKLVSLGLILRLVNPCISFDILSGNAKWTWQNGVT